MIDRIARQLSGHVVRRRTVRIAGRKRAAVPARLRQGQDPGDHIRPRGQDASSSCCAAAERRPRVLRALSSSRPSPSTERRPEAQWSLAAWGCGSIAAGPRRERVRRAPVEGGGEDVLDRVGRDELERRARLGRQLGELRARSRAAGSPASSPARCAASDFSRIPPIGSTCPVSVISPVMPTSSATGSSADERGDRRRHRHTGRRPVLRHRSRGHVDVEVVGLEPVLRQAQLAPVCERTHESAASADSCITSPSWPVIVSLPLPGYAVASMNRTSPPADV